MFKVLRFIKSRFESEDEDQMCQMVNALILRFIVLLYLCAYFNFNKIKMSQLAKNWIAK